MIEAYGGTINIFNNPYSAMIYGGSDLEEVAAPSTLNIYSKDLSASLVTNFDNINFFLPPNIKNGDTVLTTNIADLTNTTVRAGVQGNANLSTGGTIVLIKSDHLTTTNTTYGTLSEGVSLDYDLTVEQADNTSKIKKAF